jgi:hypothetical protein
MPSLDENLRRWDRDFDWSRDGEEWSAAWGGSEPQWRWSILPRIAPFLPAGTILEIAPGAGRWTRFLSGHCRRLIGVDLSPERVETCRRRFADRPHLEFHANDGRSLAAAPDGGVDLVFSFDSLVHADQAVLDAYLDQLPAKLGPDGVAFLHHSNLGAYPRHYAIASRIPRGKRWLAKLGLVEAFYHWRDPTVSATAVRARAEAIGLRCIAQETITWGTRRLIDCFSVIVRPRSRWDRAVTSFANPGFMAEAEQARQLSRLYPLAGPAAPA